MKLSFAIALLAVWAISTPLPCPAQETEKQSTKTVEKFVRITDVSGNRMTVVESAGGRGRGRARQAQTDDNSSGRGGRRRGMRGRGMPNNDTEKNSGRRRGRGRFGGQPDSSSRSENLTIAVDSDVRLTFATQARRTNEFQVGGDINGRFKNDIFRNIPSQGLSARIVSDGNRLVEVNIIQENDTSTDDIAVKPKRPPRTR